MNPFNTSRLAVVIPCVDYEDFLLLTLPTNIRVVGNVTVLTAPEDNATIALAARYGVPTMTTEAWRAGKFNKAKALNEWIECTLATNSSTWILALDADIVLPHDMALDLDDFDPALLYGAKRRMCDDPGQWAQYADRKRTIDSFPLDVPPVWHGAIWGLPTTNPAGLYGCFQLWNPAGSGRSNFPDSPSAAGYDLSFALSFGDGYRKFVPGLEVLHLGDSRTNWEGRRSAKWKPGEPIGAPVQDDVAGLCSVENPSARHGRTADTEDRTSRSKDDQPVSVLHRAVWEPILSGASASAGESASWAIAHELANLHLKTRRAVELCDLSLLFAYCAAVDHSGLWISRATECLSLIGERINWNLPLWFHGGLSGIGWTLTHVLSVLQNDVGVEMPTMAAALDEVRKDIDRVLISALERPDARITYGLSRGLAGLAVYFMDRLPEDFAVRALGLILTKLERAAEEHKDEIAWPTPFNELPEAIRKACPDGCYDLGLSQGVPAVIRVLADLVGVGFEAKRAGRLLNGSVKWIIARQHPASFPSMYTSWHSSSQIYCPSRLSWCVGEGPKRFLEQWEGILQTDGYQAYEGVGGPKIVYVGCWAHSRRKFVDAVKVNPQDGEAVKMVVRMDALFLVDRDVRQKAMSGAERLAHRRELAQPWVEEIREACLTLSKQALPKSALGKAAAYTLNQWPKLVRCLEYEEVELSNNLAENSMRPVALGRKNWLHVGSVKAGPKVAAILSVVESCRRIGVPVKEYLADVLPGLERRPLSQVATLTPARWSASRG